MSAGQSAANVTVIGSESLADIRVVDDQFPGPGVDFNGTATALSGYEWLDYPPYSADIVIYETFGGGGTIRVDTVGPPWMIAGGYVTANGNVTLTAYDSFGSVSGVVSTGGATFVDSGRGLAPNMLPSVGVANIAYAELTDSGNKHTADDHTFQPMAIPGVIVLGGIGVGVVGWLRRNTAL